MATAPGEFRFGNFVASLIWLILIVLILVALVVLPLIFIILFYLPLPPVNGEVLHTLSLSIHDSRPYTYPPNSAILNSYHSFQSCNIPWFYLRSTIGCELQSLSNVNSWQKCN